MNSREAFSQVLRNARKEKNLTQEELAELADISERYVRMLEKNTYQPSLSTLDSLSKALGIPKSEIILAIEKLEHQNT